MRFRLLATDYDGTVAHEGAIDAPTLAALARWRAVGGRLVLVTGRELDELHAVCPRLDLFNRVVAENGALLYRPETAEAVPLAPPPPPAFVAVLRARGVEPISVGRAIVATWQPHEPAVRRAIAELGLDLRVILNKRAIMVLPVGVDKASGLAVALAELGVPPGEAVAVGDAENDAAMLAACGLAVVVANALPGLKQAAHLVTCAERGAGVAELIDRLLAGSPELHYPGRD